MNYIWKRRIRKLIAACYKDFDYPELLKITKIETLPDKKKDEYHTGFAKWYGGYDHQEEKYFFDEITIGIHSNIDNDGEKLVVLHEVAHVIDRLELKSPIYPYGEHKVQFYNIVERIDPNFKKNSSKQKYYRKKN